jgi:hypothetical protein
MRAYAVGDTVSMPTPNKHQESIKYTECLQEDAKQAKLQGRVVSEQRPNSVRIV